MGSMIRARRPMRDRVGDGQAWKRRRDDKVFVIRSTWRADRRVFLVDGVGDHAVVSFTDLRTKWEQVA